ncbi:unnamed protein product [Tetraodon nigroviridis]|uniref:(spotted green pufferfish) hypothetical protein n=1 Tax=Tetraodon nigroviridis TaxID=99883 RepID=Q4RMV6_TETNG|nr:unnamed protein product [Tetraodon nigroviridis]
MSTVWLREQRQRNKARLLCRARPPPALLVPAGAGSEVSRHLSQHRHLAPGASSRPDFL